MEFFNRLVTMDETWILHMYEPETKEQSKEWRQWFPASKEVQDRSHQARCWRLSSGTKMEFCL
jgi:hypothetical protein